MPRIYTSMPAEQRFWQYVSPCPNTGCWLWTGSASRHKSNVDTYYGRIGVSIGRNSRKQIRASRLSYAMHKGPVPDDMFVCHRCDVSLCVNPDHLFLGTNKDNMADCKAKGRHRFGVLCGEKSPHSKLTDDQVRAIRSSSGTAKEIAKRFGISKSNVEFIVNRQTWKHVE